MNNNDFFNEIYKGCDKGYITLTLLPERKTLWFKINKLDKLYEAVKKYGAKTNTFFGVGLRKRILSHNLRGRDSDISCVTALYSDIDVKSNAHAQISLPNSIDEAIEFLNTLPIQSSIIVNSGNGLHAYWLLETPFKIQRTKNISPQFLRARVSLLMKMQGIGALNSTAHRT